jgi:hypothetical protein
MVPLPRTPSASWRTTCSHRCTGPYKCHCARAVCLSARILCCAQCATRCLAAAGSQVLRPAGALSQGRVVSGHTAALDVVQEAAVKKGALKAARLAVSGAFHTPLMQPARDALVKVLRLAPYAPWGETPSALHVKTVAFPCVNCDRAEHIVVVFVWVKRRPADNKSML